MAHEHPDLVARLVRRIGELSPQASILVRFGTGSEIAHAVDEGRLDLESLLPGRVATLRSGIAVSWGTMSQVHAEVEAYREATSRFAPDHLIFVSGVDYPVAALARWEQHLAGSGVDARISRHAPQDENVRKRWWVVDWAPLHRVGLFRLVYPLVWRLTRLTGGRLEVNPSPKIGDTRVWIGRRRPVSAVRPVVKASTWKTLSAKAIDAVLARYDSDPDELAWFATIRTPDEFYVPTVVHATPGLVVVDERTSFDRFAPGASSPDPVDRDLVRDAVAAGAAFVRKITPEVTPDVIAACDAAAASRPGPAPSRPGHADHD